MQPFAGPSATQTSAAAGLPFAGMPSELAERAAHAQRVINVLDGRIMAEETMMAAPTPIVKG